ncbi:MAG: hypothetical protein WD492_12995 [Alkalispirochaeta sp.]
MVDSVITAFLAGLGTAILGLFLTGIKWLWNLKNAIEDIREQNNKRGRQMQVLFRVQIHQIRAQRTTLEVVARQEINGNVDNAFRELSEAEQDMDRHAGDEAWG